MTDDMMLARKTDAPTGNAPLSDEIRRCLREFLSPINAEAAFTSAYRRSALRAGQVAPRDLPRFLPALERSLGLFLADVDLRTAMRRIGRLTAAQPRPATPRRLPSTPRPAGSTIDAGRFAIETERDVAEARKAALEHAQGLGFDPADAVKVATVVSELARNQIHYAERGTIALRLVSGSRTGIEIRAEDHGDGIPHIDTVLAGEYQSKTGLGLGLRGSRRMMDEFDVDTHAGRGTRITVRKYC